MNGEVRTDVAQRGFAWLREPVIVGCALVLTAFVVVACFGPLLVDFDPRSAELRSRLLPPFSRGDSGKLFLLGTDQLGRGILEQMVIGARVSLLVAVGTILLGGGLGSIIGLISGYAGGPMDSLIMRIGDIQLAIPGILLAILIAGILGQGIVPVIIALAATKWIIFARVARGSALVARELPFTQAADAMGVRRWRVVASHISPLAWGPLIVVATLQTGIVIVAEAGLSYLGLGSSPLLPSWGLLISNGRAHIADAWWVSTLPGVALSLVVLAIALLGSHLREYLDPSRRALNSGLRS